MVFRPISSFYFADSQCLKITETVSFNIASEASYFYILSEQKVHQNGQKWSILTSFLEMRHFWWFLDNVEIYFTRGAAIISVRFHALMLLHHFHRFSPLLLIFFQKKNKQRKSLIENALKFSFAAILSGVRLNLTLFFY